MAKTSLKNCKFEVFARDVNLTRGSDGQIFVSLRVPI